MIARRLVVSLALAGAGGSSVWAGSSSIEAGPRGASGVPFDRTALRAWLARINEAASRRNFQGTFVVSAAGGSMSSARIAHYSEGSEQFERVDSMDGEPRRVFRHNDMVHTLWPRSHVALVEQRDPTGSFPALFRGNEDGIADLYVAVPMGTERVTGREARLLAIRPRDSLRYGYRLWTDVESGLLLRAEVIGEHDEVLESSAFSEVTIGVKPEAQSVLQPMNRLAGYRVLRPTLVPARMEAEGWVLHPPVAGFRQVHCVRRPLGNEADADAALRDSREVLQAIYSDGLTYVSVFIEPYDATRPGQPAQLSNGATQTLSRRAGPAWVTVVGDVPQATLRLFANALERKQQ